MPRSDWQLIADLDIPRGLKQKLHEVVKVSKAGLYENLKTSKKAADGEAPAEKLTFLHLGQLVKLHEYFSSDPQRRRVIFEEIENRNPELAGISGVSIVDCQDEIDFQELWIFSTRPLELRLDGYAESLKDTYEAESLKMVYFVNDRSVGDELRDKIRSVTSEVTNTMVVATLVVRFMAHTVIYFEPGSPPAAQQPNVLLGTTIERLERVPEEVVGTWIVRTLDAAELLDNEGRFRWTHGVRRVSAYEELFFQLIWRC